MTQLVSKRPTVIDANQSIDQAKQTCVDVAAAALVRAKELSDELRQISELSLLPDNLKREFRSFTQVITAQSERVHSVLDGKGVPNAWVDDDQRTPQRVAG